MSLDPTVVQARPAFVRPIVAAITLIALGEVVIFLTWGLLLYPGQNLWILGAWAAICSVSLGAIIGALVDIFVTGRRAASAAFVWTAAIWFAVLASCTYLCFRIDLAAGGRFGAADAPTLFISAGFIPAFLASFLYAWLVTTPKGQGLLSRAGL
ncbi:MAG: hypothetical protein OEO83_04495 [Alphaproteobacteria bacterium]|nr:hypothetical protein [Alphaproteobacteria bacterium]